MLQLNGIELIDTSTWKRDLEMFVRSTGRIPVGRVKPYIDTAKFAVCQVFTDQYWPITDAINAVFVNGIDNRFDSEEFCRMLNFNSIEISLFGSMLIRHVLISMFCVLE